MEGKVENIVTTPLKCLIVCKAIRKVSLIDAHHQLQNLALKHVFLDVPTQFRITFQFLACLAALGEKSVKANQCIEQLHSFMYTTHSERRTPKIRHLPEVVHHRSCCNQNKKLIHCFRNTHQRLRALCVLKDFFADNKFSFVILSFLTYPKSTVIFYSNQLS